MTGSTSWITAASARTRRRALGASVAVTALAWCVQAQALPVVGSAGGVVGGSATIGTVGTTETITQTSSRALIQWSSFNVASGETVNFNQTLGNSSITFNVIPFNFNTQANINGIITAQGGVWLYSPRGAIIGPNANINVGSFLLTTGTTDYTLQAAGGGNFPTPPAIPPELGGNSISIFGATASIDVQNGAQINAGAGFVVLNSETTIQDGTVTATDGIAYAVGDSATVSFNPSGESGGQELDGIDVSGSLAGEPSLIHSGSSKGLWVGVYAPDTAAPGFTGVINMNGVTEATGLAPSSADNTAVLLVGDSDTSPPSFTNDITDVNTTAGTITADKGGLLADGGTIELGTATVNGDINVYAELSDSGPGNSPLGGTINIGSANGSATATVTAGGNIFLGSQSGTVSINGGSTVQANGNITLNGLGSASVTVGSGSTVVAAGNVNITSQSATVTLGAGSTVQADSQGDGEAGVTIEGAGVNADPSSQVFAGTDFNDPTGDVSITADFNDLNVGNVAGSDVTLTAGAASPPFCDSDCSPVGGNLNINGNIVGTSSVTVTAFNGTVDVEANVTSGGPLSITASGDVDVDNLGNGITLESNSFGDGDEGDIEIEAGGQYVASSNSTLQGGPDGSNPTAGVHVEADGGDLTTGIINGTDVELTTGNDIFVEGPVFGSNSVSFDPANITLHANVTSGGKLDISASNTVTINAGVVVMSAGDLTVEAETVDADPSSLLLAGTDQADPTGDVDVAAEGGNLTVGQVSGVNVTFQTDGALTINGSVLGTTSVNMEGGDGGVPDTITVGPNVTVTSGGDLTVEATNDVFADASSLLTSSSHTGNVSVISDQGNVTVGQVTGAVVTLTAGSSDSCDDGCGPSGGDLTINGTILGTNAVTATTFKGDIDIEANVTSVGAVQITSAGDITFDTAGAGLLIQSDTGGEGAGPITIDAAGSYTASGKSELRGGDNADAPEDAVSITAENGDLTTGMVNGTNVSLNAGTGNVTVNGAVFGSNSVTFDPFNITLNANVTSGGVLNIAASNTVTVSAGVTVQSAGDMTIDADNEIDIGQNAVIQSGGDISMEADVIDADGSSLIEASADGETPSGSVTVTADTGDLILGGVSGTVVKLTSGFVGTDCGSDCEVTGGDVTLNGPVLGTTSVDVEALNGGIDVEADITSGGALTIGATGDVTVDQNQNGIVIESDTNGGGGDINITAGGTYSADAGSTLQGGADPDAAVNVTAGGDLTTGMVNATDVTLTTPADLTIAGAVFGSNSVTFDPANVFINANVTSGGVLDITAGDAVDVAPDVTVMSAGDLTITADAVDADATSLLVAGTDASHPTAAVSISASNGGLTVGQVTGTTVTLTAGSGEGGGDLNILGAIFASSEVDGAAPNGAIDVEANVIAGGPVHLTSGDDIDVGLTSGSPVLIESDSGGTGAGDIEISAGGAYDAANTSELRGGPNAAAPTQSVSITTLDGDMTTGIINGTDVNLTTAAGDDLTVNGAVFGSNSVTIDPANILFNANVTSGGALSVTATDTITVSAGVTLRSDNKGAGTGNLSLTAGTIDADAASQLTAGAKDIAPTANVTVLTKAGDIAVGGVSGKVVSLTSAGDLTLDGPVLALTSFTSSSALNTAIDGSVVSDGSATLTSTGNTELAAGDSITAATFVKITGLNVTLDANTVVRSDSGGETANPAAVTIDAKDSFFAVNSSLVVGGASKTAPTAAVAITAGDNTLNEGGDLTSGPISGTTVTLNAFGGSDEETGGHGNLDIDGAILGTQGVFAYSDHGNNGTLPGSTNVEANVTSGGTIDIRSEGVGNLTIGQGEGSSTVVVSSSGGEVYLFSNAAIFANDGAQVSGVSLDATAEGTLNIESGASFATTGSTTAPVWPTAPVTVVANPGGAAPTVTSLNLAAATLNIQGTVTAGKGGTTDDIYIQALGSPALVTVGGTGASGFNLTSAEFADLSARNVVVMAGGGEGATHNADLNLASLAINPAKVGGLWLGTSSDHTVTVSGVVTGAGDALNIGFAEAPASGTVLVGYIPGEIDITGSIGSTASPFASVGLLARNNIFMGTSAFITAAKADPTFNAVTQSKTFTGLAQGYVFIASNTLQLGAQQRIIQQNTSTLTGQGDDQFTGLVFNAPTSASPLIADPASLSGKTIGAGGWAANYGAGPTAIDVFGLIRQTDESVVSGVDAALQDNLLPTAIKTSNSYRINSCIFGTNCSINPNGNVPGEVQFQDPTDPNNTNNGTDPIIPPADGGSSSAANAANAIAGQTFLDNIVEPAASFADTLVNGSPVTQSGNGDLWQGPNGSVGCTPTADHPCPPPGQ